MEASTITAPVGRAFKRAKAAMRADRLRVAIGEVKRLDTRYKQINASDKRSRQPRLEVAGVGFSTPHFGTASKMNFFSELKRRNV
jgi:hypothetical protein